MQNSIHMRLDVGYGIPGQPASRTLGNGNMELLILAPEGIVVVDLLRCPLARQNCVDAPPCPAVKRFACALRYGHFDGLPHEAGFHHLPGGDTHHDRAAVGPYIHQF